MPGLGRRIMEACGSAPAGSVVTVDGMAHLGKRPSVARALVGLARSGKLERICPGHYIALVPGRFGAYLPPVWDVMESLSEAWKVRIVPTGAIAANRLGLTTQNPIRPVFLTSGRPRELRYGNGTVTLLHAPSWLTTPSGRAGEALRALEWLGEGMGRKAGARLRGTLGESDVAAIESLEGTPRWIVETLSGPA